MLRLVQLTHPTDGRRVAVVEEPKLNLLSSLASVFDLARAAITSNRPLAAVVEQHRTAESLDYDLVYRLRSPWRLLPPFDHPGDPGRCLVTGTGLTHKGSADNRQSMHVGDEIETDSMKMYRIGLEGGRPEPGRIGAAPEWFYKGCGTILRAHGEPLDAPNFADDGGDEAEIAGAYLIGPDGTPYRVGLVQGNEFSDHVLEAKNYAYLAPSKLRTCAVGPELIVGADFADVPGRIRIERGKAVIWEANLVSGERAMCHSLANLEHHHFKYEQHRRPGDAHVHFFGADNFSFRDRVRLEDGDVMEVAFAGFGRPLRNPVRIDRSRQVAVTVKVL
ncbi:MAG TPA: AraD1 family protein [Gemmataceae bacterium]|nr:AraD1 family protein [Gemmataceae bacterium]